jgi:gas vesicle protein
MLNLLIAVMGEGFEKVKVDETPHAMLEQAMTIVEYERLLTHKWLSIWDPQNKDKFPRYMVIAEERETQGEETADGITGRMRKRVDALEKEIKRQHEEMKRQHEETQRLLGALMSQRSEQ